MRSTVLRRLQNSGLGVSREKRPSLLQEPRRRARRKAAIRRVYATSCVYRVPRKREGCVVGRCFVCSYTQIRQHRLMFCFVFFFVSFEALTYPAPQVATSIEKPSGRTVVRFMPDRAISRCFCALLGRLLTCRNVAQLLYHETLGLDGHSPFLTKSERSRRHDPMEPISTKVHRHGARRLRTLAIGLAKMSNLSTTVRLLSQ